MMPSYTIFIPLYDADIHFDNICNNIRIQKLKVDQIIVIDDTKNSPYFIKKLNDFLSCKNITNEFTIIKNKNNLKPSKSWNLNYHLFKNNLIFRMDADDTWSPNHTSTMINEYLNDKNCSIYTQKNITSLFKKVFYNYEFIFTNQAIHASTLINLNKGKILYPYTNYPFDDLLMFIKYKYIFKRHIKFVNRNTCKVNLNFKNRWSEINTYSSKKKILKKYFFLALKKKLSLKKINFLSLYKIFTNFNLFQAIYIVYKIFK